MFRLFFFLLTVFSLKAFAYEDKSHIYKIDEPSGWTLSEKENDIQEIVQFKASPDDSEDSFLESIIISYEYAPSTMTLEENFQAGITGFQKKSKDITVEDTGTTYLDKVEAKWFTYIDRSDKPFFKSKMYLMMIDSHALIVAYAANVDDFAKYEPLFEKSVTSLTFLKPAAENIFEFRTALAPDSYNYGMPLKPWTKEEKAKFFAYLDFVKKEAPGLYERATAYPPLKLYRVEKITLFKHEPTAMAVPIGGDIYFGDKFFQPLTHWRGGDFNLSTFVHELAHVSDPLYKNEYTTQWIKYHNTAKKKVLERIKQEGLTLEEAQKADRNDLAFVVGVPSLYSLTMRRESLAEYVQALVLDKDFKPSKEITDFIDKHYFSKLEKPDDSLKHGKKGFSYYLQKKNDEALQEFNKALNLDRNDVYSHFYRGELLFSMKKDKEALRDMTEVIKRLPDDDVMYRDGLRLKGRIEMVLNEFPHAIEDFNQLIELEPDLGVNYYWRALAFYASDENEKARADLEKAIKLDPALETDAKKFLNKIEKEKVGFICYNAVA